MGMLLKGRSMTKNRTILIVDDDVISIRIIEDHLQGNLYQTASAESGESAWGMLSKSPADYDVVIVDRLMEGMDGLELTRKIKADPQLTNLPVIVQTGQADPDEFIAALNAGAFDFIYKPVEQELLLYVIENALVDGRC